MGESSDGDEKLFQVLPTLLPTTIASKLHSVENSALLLVLFVLIILIGGGLGDTELLSSDLQPCQQIRENVKGLQCLSKILLQFSLLHGKKTLSDTMETFVTHVQESGGAMRALDVPYLITIYKSDIYAQYPIEYVQSFNDNPHEVAISSPHCQDGDNNLSPDCGWLYNKHGEKVKDSQGFCCMCDVETKFPLWLEKNKSLRVIQDCNETSSISNLFSWTRPGSAHCLRLSQKWYPTYKLGEPTFSTSVRVVIQMLHSRDGQPHGLEDMHYQTLRLSPLRSVQVHSNGTLKAHLQGDFKFNIPLPLLQDMYLSIPMEEGKSEKVAHANQWLTLPKHYFTLDGKECDKIGVSYSAFKFQAKACDQPFQSCCGNQLNDYAQADLQRKLAGKAPKYAFSQYGEAVVQDRNNALEPTTLNLHIDKEMASFLTIELEAPRLKYYKERSTGKILKASVERFETGTRRFHLQVDVINIGIIKAYFKLKVVECTTKVDIFPVEIHTPLMPAIVTSFWISLLIREDIDTFNSSIMSCKVIMFDTLWEMSSKVEMQFEVQLNSKLHVGHSPALTRTTKHFTVFGTCFFWCNETQSYIKPPPPPAQADACLWNCTHWYSASCFVVNFCWDKLEKFLGIVAAIILGAFVLFLLLQTGALSVILEYVGVVVSKSTKTAKSVGKKVKSAQRRRQRKRMRQGNRDHKQAIMQEFTEEKLENEEDKAYEKLVLGVTDKKKKKGRKNKDGEEGEDDEEDGEGKTQGQKGKKKGGKQGKKGKKGKKGKQGKKGKKKKKGKKGKKGKKRKPKKDKGDNESKEDEEDGEDDDDDADDEESGEEHDS